MECSKVMEQLYEYIYKELDQDKAYNVEMHLRECPHCFTEYKELKKLLADDMVDLYQLRANIETPVALKKKIRSSLKPPIRLRLFRYAIAAVVLSLLFHTIPAFAAYIIQTTLFDKYIPIAGKELVTEFKQGKGQIIGKSSTLNGITFTVDGIIQKEDHSILLFTIKIPKSKDYNYGIPAGYINALKITDQFGRSYMPHGGAITIESMSKDGEAKCMQEFEAIKVLTYKMKAQITAIELGNYDPEVNIMQKYKNTYGEWSVSFYTHPNRWKGDSHD